METLQIPNSVQKEIALALTGRKLVKRKMEKKSLPDEETASRALANLALLNKIASTNPLQTLVVQKGVKLFILCEGITYVDVPSLKATGSLILRKLGEEVGVYYWQDADYPVNRSERDYELITEEFLKRSLSRNSIELIANLTKRKIWAAIKKSIQAYRKHIS